VRIRRYAAADFDEWRRMRMALWPDHSAGDREQWLARTDAVILVADTGGGRLAGFAEVGTRSYADGCETSPVAYLEGWWVDEDFRRQGVGGSLIEAAEAWARERGCTELASDAELHNVISQTAHARLGFMEVGRSVLFRKALNARLRP
jgi:aminoglycoside 6'-N-acetyltransferase I